MQIWTHTAGNGGRLRRCLRASGAAFLLLALPSFAQSSCEEAIRQAEKKYQLGLFEDVPAELEPCRDAKISRSVAVQLHSLLARTYIASDELDKARDEVSAILRVDPDFEATSPQRFALLLAQVRREESVVQVASVSKTKESLREAPATVVVVTGEEIERRGYVDLEQLIHDLPGFDITRANGVIYSYLYQRGYRSGYSDRNLLLLDGVEQNDLSTNTLYLSRQYSLSNIDRVEVVYGPASTMYGANAYTGVINIITKEPEAFIPDDKKLGYTVQAVSGGLATRSADFTLAGRDGSGNLAWSLAGRVFRSDEPDLAGLPDWDYTYKTIDYKQRMRLTGPLAAFFTSLYSCAPGASPYYECRRDASGNLSIELTDAGESLTRELDQRLLQQNGFGFSDKTEAWSLYGRLRVSNLTLGFQSWRAEEGTSSAIKAASHSGLSTWTPRQTLFYLRYSQPTGKDLTFNSFTRFQQSGLDQADSRWVYLHNYANGFLGMGSLVSPCIWPLDLKPVGCAPASPWVEDVAFGDLSTQLRSELSLVYEPSGKLNAVGGVELWKSSIQSQFIQDAVGPGALIATDIKPEQIEHTDLAVYAQASYRLRPSLKLVLAGRANYNQINNQPESYGFGTLFSPRAAVVYTPSAALVLKGIYSEAFKDPQDFQKFGILRYVNEYASTGLRPERVRNSELVAGWSPSEAFSFDASAYQADYSDVVALRLVPGCTAAAGCLQYQNQDEIRIRGLQIQGRYQWRGLEIRGNYTFTEPFQTNPEQLDGSPLLNGEGNRVDELRVGDIASHRLNLGFAARWKERLGADLRIRWVGPRKTGRGTTVPANPLDQVDAYAVADATVNYDLRQGATLQLIVDNLFDKDYADPGNELQIGPASIPQPGRTVYFRLIAKRSRAKGAAGAEQAEQVGRP
ncbi:MAG TPA: TonB-dependent receptor [Thermoanaerobaculia bacterium]|nr:TonB-dependent receptor [Thermoanaerobaculia bacterium]